MCLVLSAVIFPSVINGDVLPTVETDAGDDRQDAGPDAEAGRRRGGRVNSPW